MPYTAGRRQHLAAAAAAVEVLPVQRNTYRPRVSLHLASQNYLPRALSMLETARTLTWVRCRGALRQMSKLKTTILRRKNTVLRAVATTASVFSSGNKPVVKLQAPGLDGSI